MEQHLEHREVPAKNTALWTDKIEAHIEWIVRSKYHGKLPEIIRDIVLWKNGQISTRTNEMWKCEWIQQVFSLLPNNDTGDQLNLIEEILEFLDETVQIREDFEKLSLPITD